MNALKKYLNNKGSIAPLVSFRMIFGVIMAFGAVRFAYYGWIKKLYIDPSHHFSYYGFDWIEPLPGIGMYLVFGVIFLSALGVALGAFYRVSSVLFFLSFTYVELIDKTTYLNHYYFVSIVAFLLCLVPAHRFLSVDVWRKPELRQVKTRSWHIAIFKLQLGMVYFFAGIAKINADWLFRAMPLKIWLPGKSSLPIFGKLLTYEWTAYFFSWFGMLYDILIPFFLLWKKSRLLAYAAVIAFHVMTWSLFQIGIFPWVMIGSTLIFFSANWHEKIHKKLFGASYEETKSAEAFSELQSTPRMVTAILAVHFALQILLPFRYALYPGDLFWNEQGYRFSWRVMLMEKAGYVTFHVSDPETGKSGIVDNSEYLTPLQEKQMSMQPDMILEMAHWIAEDYRQQGFENIEVKAESYATLNGSGSRPFIDPDVNLVEKKQGFAHKNWILSYE
ncbi:HTTM domain-containing protein [Halocola ammonii]